MKEIFIIEFSAYHHYLDDDRENREEREVFGAFDTARRAVCYLRRFLSEDDGPNYYDHSITITEDLSGPISAKAVRRYKFNDKIVTETLSMRKIVPNNLQSPYDEILNFYC